jgi:hypothetical protein
MTTPTQPLTEADVRRMVREEIDASRWTRGSVGSIRPSTEYYQAQVELPATGHVSIRRRE